MAFYVYIYSDPSKNDEIFYIGKGSKNRCFDHLKRKDNHPMTNKIKKMISEQTTPTISKIECSGEAIAFELEIGLIKMLGRKDIGSGTLLNLTDGGENPPKKFGKNNNFYGKIGVFCNNRKGSKLSEEHKQKISSSSKGRVSAKGMLNKTHSLESKLKIRESNLKSSIGKGRTWIIDNITGKRVWVDKNLTNSNKIGE